MKDEILLELANKWMRDADPKNQVEDGSDDAKIGNAVSRGHRECKRECADTLRSLVAILGA